MSPSPSPPPSRKRPRAPQERAIIALDLDCFYAQVAIRSRPHLANRPVVIVQKHLCVTSNYVARRLAHGAVQKMTPVSTALKACPDLVCIDGSDLTPFRAANAEVMAVIREWLRRKVAELCVKQFQVPCQKLGFDEVFIDISRLADAAIASGGQPWAFEGHVFGTTPDDSLRRFLMVASQLASELRKLITDKTKLSLCAGISDSKLLAKLAVNMNKPNDQTTFLPGNASHYIASQAPRSLPGFGYAAEGKLNAWTIANRKPELKTSADVLRCFGDGKTGLKTLSTILGNEGQAWKILDLCRGVDMSDVIESGDAPKSITSMDSFRTCTTIEDVQQRVMVRAKDLVSRLLHDAERHSRTPKTLNVGYRFRGDGYHGTSRAIPMPMEVMALSSSKGAEAVDASVKAITRATLFGLKEHAAVSPSTNFDMTLISIGATNFSDGRVSQKKQLLSAKMTSFFQSQEGNQAESDASRNERMREFSHVVSNAQCPICDRNLPSSVAMANAHVNNCLRRSEMSSKPKKKPKTVSNTRPVESFFQRR